MTGAAPTTLRAALASGVFDLTAAGVPSPEHDAIALLAHVLDVGVGEVRSRLALRRALSGAHAQAYAALLAERGDRVPLQHLTGRAGFRNLDLHVGPGVFVPRPETEEVAALAIAAAFAAVEAGVAEPVVVDLCTGSGAIALAIKDEVPAARVVAVDVSALALAWAARNLEATGLEVELVSGDATRAEQLPQLAQVVGRVDVVVSNPPYIPTGMVPTDPEVRDHDPDVALYGGSADGLAIPLAVAAAAAHLLHPGGVLVMEHADSQGEALPARLRHTGVWTEVRDEHDRAGRPRTTVAVRAHASS